MSAVIDVNEADFEQRVLQSEKPVLVDFWAPWCGPCRAFGPIFEDAAEAFSAEATFAKLNVDDNKSIAEQYDVHGIPQVLLFRDGRVADRFVGGASREAIARMFRPATPQTLRELTDADFDEQVKASVKPVFVAFGKPAAGVYRSLIDTLERVSRQLGERAAFFTVNTANAPQTAQRFTDRTVLFLFENGRIIDRMDGQVPEELIASMLSSIERQRPVPEVTSAEFDRNVLKSASPVLLDVWTPNHGLYRRAADIVRERFSKRVQYLKLDCAQYPDIVERYRLFPGEACLMLFKDGKVVTEIYGCVGGPYLSKDEVAATIDTFEKESTADGSVRELDQESFERDVRHSAEPALVYVGAHWMGSDTRIARLVSERFGDKVRVFKLDAGPDLLKELRIDDKRPWLLLFKDGEAVYRGIGYYTASREEDIVTGLRKHIAA